MTIKATHLRKRMIMRMQTRKQHPIHHHQQPLSMMMFFLLSFPLPLLQLLHTILRLSLIAGCGASSAPVVHDEMRS
jgi:hypothetical protein